VAAGTDGLRGVSFTAFDELVDESATELVSEEDDEDALWTEGVLPTSFPNSDSSISVPSDP
jgi:hypothetical protein